MSTISIFTSMTNPDERKDPWEQALSCYQDLADDVITIGKDFPDEFKWDYFGEIFQDAFNHSKGDWVFRMDVDYFFHEKDIPNIKRLLKKYSTAPPLIKILWQKDSSKGKLFMEYKTNFEGTTQKKQLLAIPGYKKFKVTIISKDGLIEVFYDNVLKFKKEVPYWSTFTNYFKAGNYIQTQDATKQSKIAFYSLKVKSST